MNQVVRTALRMDDIHPFHVMDVLARARSLETQGRTVIHMEIGEPDFITPQPVIEEGIRALRAGRTHYTPALGLSALREEIAAYYQEHYNVDVSPQRLIVTPGASGALQLVLGVLVNPGDQVLMADPGYPCNRHFVRLFEGRATSIPIDSSTDYQLTADLIDAHWSDQTVAVLLASPSNPTGTIIDGRELSRISACVERHGGVLIMDEIYHGLVYEGDPGTALELSERVFVINSFSKYFGMTGWRIGWLAAPLSYVPVIDRLAQNIFLAPSTPAQYAALAAFRPDTLDILERRREEFMARRDFLLPALRDLGFEIPLIPQGAFYLYAGCERFGKDSYALTMELLEKAGVAITPGRDFGEHAAERHVRFAYTTSLENLREGVERLRSFLAR